MTHDQFWRLTPKQVSQTLEAFFWRRKEENNGYIITAYYAAVLVRTKKIPRLSELTREKKPQTIEEQIAIFKSLPSNHVESK